MIPVIYISGPYTRPDPCQNTNRAIHFADTLMEGPVCWPLVPHLSHLWHTVAPRPWTDWIALDLALLERCDGLIRLTGDSDGADMEVRKARELGLPMLLDIDPDSFWAPRVTAWIADLWGDRGDETSSNNNRKAQPHGTG